MHVNNNADSWDEQINKILGPNFPLFGVVGNHDIQDEFSWPEFQDKLKQRLNRIEGISCVGEIGIMASCSYNGIFFIQSGVGTKGANNDHYPEIPVPFNKLELTSKIYSRISHLISNYIYGTYIKDQLKNNDFKWKICLWHKDQETTQIGDKPDEVGWKSYEECRKGGAFIVNGHTHTYARSYLMSNFKYKEIASDSNILKLEKGKSFVVTPSLGGMSIRKQNEELASNPWWAKTYSAEDNADFGALFCIFNFNGKEDQSYCYFKNIKNETIDSFWLSSN